MTLPLSVWKWKNGDACHLELWLNRERLHGRGPRCAQAVRCPQHTNNGLLYSSGLIATSDWKRSVLFCKMSWKVALLSLGGGNDGRRWERLWNDLYTASDLSLCLQNSSPTDATPPGSLIVQKEWVNKGKYCLAGWGQNFKTQISRQLGTFEQK